MTITVTGDDDILEQIEKQLAKLIDVKEIVELPMMNLYAGTCSYQGIMYKRGKRQQITTRC